ncbi:MAG: hypothetical protein HRT47_04180 [Candidatus Caenarcaniphilales bacterium]|nr:hypothetical protein [Candidatus Caenarcaniphilales bacterium]
MIVKERDYDKEKLLIEDLINIMTFKSSFEEKGMSFINRQEAMRLLFDKLKYLIKESIELKHDNEDTLDLISKITDEFFKSTADLNFPKDFSLLDITDQTSLAKIPETILFTAEYSPSKLKLKDRKRNLGYQPSLLHHLCKFLEKLVTKLLSEKLYNYAFFVLLSTFRKSTNNIEKYDFNNLEILYLSLYKCLCLLVDDDSHNAKEIFESLISNLYAESTFHILDCERELKDVKYDFLHSKHKDDFQDYLENFLPFQLNKSILRDIDDELRKRIKNFLDECSSEDKEKYQDITIQIKEIVSRLSGLRLMQELFLVLGGYLISKHKFDHLYYLWDECPKEHSNHSLTPLYPHLIERYTPWFNKEIELLFTLLLERNSGDLVLREESFLPFPFLNIWSSKESIFYCKVFFVFSLVKIALIKDLNLENEISIEILERQNKANALYLAKDAITSLKAIADHLNNEENQIIKELKNNFIEQALLKENIFSIKSKRSKETINDLFKQIPNYLLNIYEYIENLERKLENQADSDLLKVREFNNRVVDSYEKTSSLPELLRTEESKVMEVRDTPLQSFKVERKYFKVDEVSSTHYDLSGLAKIIGTRISASISTYCFEKISEQTNNIIKLDTTPAEYSNGYVDINRRQVSVSELNKIINDFTDENKGNIALFANLRDFGQIYFNKDTNKDFACNFYFFDAKHKLLLDHLLLIDFSSLPALKVTSKRNYQNLGNLLGLIEDSAMLEQLNSNKEDPNYSYKVVKLYDESQFEEDIQKNKPKAVKIKLLLK